MRWLPIETAPKNQPILGWVNHEADPYINDNGKLTPYGTHCEGLLRAPDGVNILEWGGIYWDEYDNLVLPAYWFVRGSDFETVANPTHWMPLPEGPW